MKSRRWSRTAEGSATVGLGVLLLSPDSLFVLAMTMNGATVLLFRGAFSMLGYLALAHFSLGQSPRAGTWGAPATGLPLSCLAVLGNIGFVVSIRHVSAALALVIIAAAPVFTTVLSWAVGSEPVPGRTWIAIGMVLGGIGVIFAAEPEGGELIGGLAALGASIAIAALLVIVRRNPDLDPLPWQAVGGLLTALLMLPLSAPGSATPTDLALAVSFGLLLQPLAVTLIIQGPRFLSAPETSLLLLLEAILGPAWIWLILGQAPSSQAALAAAIILGTLAVHAVLAQRALRAIRAPG